jgi:hypothetical protein
MLATPDLRPNGTRKFSPGFNPVSANLNSKPFCPRAAVEVIVSSEWRENEENLGCFVPRRKGFGVKVLSRSQLNKCSGEGKGGNGFLHGRYRFFFGKSAFQGKSLVRRFSAFNAMAPAS